VRRIVQGVLRAFLAKLRSWWRREAMADTRISSQVLESRRAATKYTDLAGPF
jgi:hypothetical protein